MWKYYILTHKTEGKAGWPGLWEVSSTVKNSTVSSVSFLPLKWLSSAHFSCLFLCFILKFPEHESWWLSLNSPPSLAQVDLLTAFPRPPVILRSESESRLVVSDSLWPHGLSSFWNSLGKNTGGGSLSFLQGIFPTQGSNPGLPHCRQILYQLSHKGSPRILEWVACPFSSGSSQPRNETGVSCITGGFFTNRAIREAELQGKPKNTGVGSISLLQWIFQTQESNWGLLFCRWILYQLSYQGNP